MRNLPTHRGGLASSILVSRKMYRSLSLRWPWPRIHKFHSPVSVIYIEVNCLKHVKVRQPAKLPGGLSYSIDHDIFPQNNPARKYHELASCEYERVIECWFSEIHPGIQFQHEFHVCKWWHFAAHGLCRGISPRTPISQFLAELSPIRYTIIIIACAQPRMACAEHIHNGIYIQQTDIRTRR